MIIRDILMAFFVSGIIVVLMWLIPVSDEHQCLAGYTYGDYNRVGPRKDHKL